MVGARMYFCFNLCPLRWLAYESVSMEFERFNSKLRQSLLIFDYVFYRVNVNLSMQDLQAPHSLYQGSIHLRFRQIAWMLRILQ